MNNQQTIEKNISGSRVLTLRPMKPTFILLVEDEPVIAHDLRIELELAGCQVIAASDTATALALCSRHLPDAAILNFHFKTQMDGMELARLNLRSKCLDFVIFTN